MTFLISCVREMDDMTRDKRVLGVIEIEAEARAALEGLQALSDGKNIFQMESPTPVYRTAEDLLETVRREPWRIQWKKHPFGELD